MRNLRKIAARCWRAISDFHTLQWLWGELLAGTGFTGISIWVAIQSYVGQQPPYLVIASAAWTVAAVVYCVRVVRKLRRTVSKPRLFEVEHVVPAYKVVGEKEYFDITVTLRFLRPIRGASILLHVYGVGRRTIELIKNDNYAEGAERRLIVARIPYKEATENAVWGSPGYTENPPLVAGSENVAVIDLQASEPPPRRQKFRLYIKMMQIGTGASGRFFLTDESRNLFDLHQLQRGKGISFTE